MILRGQRLGYKLARVAFGVFQDIQIDVDIQIQPVTAIQRAPKMVNPGNSGMIKICIIFKGYKVFLFWRKQPEAILFNIGDLGASKLASNFAHHPVHRDHSFGKSVSPWFFP